jgi:hypothetical protein
MLAMPLAGWNGSSPGGPGRLAQRCACRAPGAAAARERRRLVDLLRLLEHPDALPAPLALRLGVELLALTRGGQSRFACEAIGGSAR